MENFKDIIRNTRQNKGKSRKDFAEELGVSINLISNLEKGKIKFIEISQLDDILNRINNYNSSYGELKKYEDFLEKSDYLKFVSDIDLNMVELILKYFVDMSEILNKDFFCFNIRELPYEEFLKIEINKYRDKIYLCIIANNCRIVEDCYNLNGIAMKNNFSPELKAYIYINLLKGYLSFQKTMNQIYQKNINQCFKKIMDKKLEQD